MNDRDTTPPPTELRRRAREAYAAGDILRATQIQAELVNAARAARNIEPRDLKFLYFLFFTRGDMQQCLVAIDEYLAHRPDDVETLGNKAHLLATARQFAEANAILERALQIDPDDTKCLAMLCDMRQRNGDIAGARAAGLRVLELVTQRHGTAQFDPRNVSVPPFRKDAPERNVISFSLWGTSDRYLSGALRNARLARDLYPAWRARFYVDATVPRDVLDQLRDEAADIVMMPAPSRDYAGLFWRFLVADDPHVDRYLIRDADSVINTRERVAVDAWIASGRHFHVMRDWWTHVTPIMAGMWGGVRGALPPLAPLIDSFVSEAARRAQVGRIIDHMFLQEKIWPIVRKSVLAHDSIFRFDGAEDFPPYGELGAGLHVGQDDVAWRRMMGQRPKGRTLTPFDVGMRNVGSDPARSNRS
jgi:hypothetical protein